MMRLNNITIILGLALLCIPFHISYGQGARYTGSYTKSAAIKHVGKSNFVIEGFEISSNDADAIHLSNCENVVIRNNKLGPSPTKKGIYLYNCKNVTIVDNTFENVQSGLVAYTSQGIKFEYNDVTNILGRLKGSNDVGVMAQFIQVSGAGNSVSYNVCENFPGESSTEDIINLYQSHGTAQSPIVVKGNWIRGGGPSDSGGGINLGDLSGSYQLAEDNILVNPGQYGIGISGGQNMTLRNNKVYGSRQSFSNVGIVAANWYENLGQTQNITVSNNIVNYTHKDGYVNNWWYAGNIGTINGKETNKYDASLNASILPDKIIGRARSSSTPSTPGGGSTPIPEDNNPDPAPKPEEKPGNTDKDNEASNPGTSLPEVKNDRSIQIYIDRFNRVCVNIWGFVTPSANIVAYNEAGEIIYRQDLTRFHTVLSNSRPNPGKYTLLVRNGDKAHMKTLNIR